MVESNILQIVDDGLGPENPAKVIAFYILNAARSSVESIKLKPKKKIVDIIYDGSVAEQLPVVRYAPICKRIKTMAGMDPSSKERQKGNIKISMLGEDYDMKVSSRLTQYGEKLELLLQKC